MPRPLQLPACCEICMAFCTFLCMCALPVCVMQLCTCPRQVHRQPVCVTCSLFQSACPSPPHAVYHVVCVCVCVHACVHACVPFEHVCACVYMHLSLSLSLSFSLFIFFLSFSHVYQMCICLSPCHESTVLFSATKPNWKTHGCQAIACCELDVSRIRNFIKKTARTFACATAPQ